MYPDPSVCSLERFFKGDGALNDGTVSYTFGFGRRICTGHYLADESVWSAIATLLATWVFEAPKDEHGEPYKFKPQFTGGLTSHPKPFLVDCTLL
ncbi:hypothetical protein HYDPIDRAFT_109876 [Hydnomerulius pinastri MD-312]|nr:hypothetical protein HYDPIDRAFT_109876 [Hydnomerulius pinastri MD-312]